MIVIVFYRTRILSGVSFLQSKFLVVYICVFGLVYGMCMYMCVFVWEGERERERKGKGGRLSCMCMACMYVCGTCVVWYGLHVGMWCVRTCGWCVYASVCTRTCMALSTPVFIVQTNRQCMIYDISSEFVMAEE